MPSPAAGVGATPCTAIACSWNCAACAWMFCCIAATLAFKPPGFSDDWRIRSRRSAGALFHASDDAVDGVIQLEVRRPVRVEPHGGPHPLPHGTALGDAYLAVDLDR